jgi:cytochrome c5
MKMKAARDNILRYTLIALAVLSVAVLLPTSGRTQAQTQAPTQAPLSAEEARFIEFGKEIFKSKAVCQFCHKWDASGDQG